MAKYIIIYLFFFVIDPIQGQTCCSAGAPISSSLDIANAEKNTINIQISYEYKSINLLIDNNDRLINDDRSRSGQNFTTKIDYTLSQRFAFTLLAPTVYQSRSTFSENQHSLGLGDISILGQYSLFSNQETRFNVSAGIKIPTGATNHLGSSQIFLSPDMQSGTGTLDYLIRSSITKEHIIIPFLLASFSIVYRKNGVNKTFAKTGNFEGRSFGFGDELLSSLNLNYTLVTKHGFFVPNLGLSYRRTEANAEQNNISPNSGGNWLSLPWGISFVPDKKKSFMLFAEHPLYQKLEGVQISTSLTIGFQFNYAIQKTKK